MIGPFRTRLKLGSDNCQILTQKVRIRNTSRSVGGSMDISVKERVKWPHEFALAGSTKNRITYNQLNITQWMSGFCRILRDES